MENTVFGWIFDKQILPNQTLNQGDLIFFENEQDELRKMGIIVTADCDLKNNKHARLITLVPVTSAKLVIERYLLIEDLEKRKKSIEGKIDAVLNIEDDFVKVALYKEKMSHYNQQDVVYEMLKFLTHDSESIDFSVYQQICKYCDLAPKKQDSIQQQLRNKGDLMILPTFKESPMPVSVAWVRHIWQVPVKEIAIKSSDAKSKRGLKIARLDSPFRYRLTQLMGQVFSDIGLPDIEDEINRSVSEVVSK